VISALAGTDINLRQHYFRFHAVTKLGVGDWRQTVVFLMEQSENSRVQVQPSRGPFAVPREGAWRRYERRGRPPEKRETLAKIRGTPST